MKYNPDEFAARSLTLFDPDLARWWRRGSFADAFAGTSEALVSSAFDALTRWSDISSAGSLSLQMQGIQGAIIEIHSGKGDPNPIKHLGTLIKRVQSAIATAIAEAGFVFVSKSMLPIKGSFALDYSRGDLFLTCWYDRPNATLIAEVLDNAANCTRVASIPMNAPRSGLQVLDRISEFADEVNQYLVSLPSAGDAG